MKVRPTGIELNPASAGNCSTKRQSGKRQVQESAHVQTFPPDLQQVIVLWDTLPAKIKQVILTLIQQETEA